MADKIKTREITILDNRGAFSVFFKKLTGESENYDFEGLTALRRLLSNQRARILHVIKIKKPKSIYELAKILKRDLKSVNTDIELLERFGFIDLIAEKSGARQRHRPILVIDSLNIKLKI